MNSKSLDELAERALLQRYAKCEMSLSYYFKCAWRVLEPKTPLLWNWHIDCSAEHLEAVELGQIKRLLVTIQPRSIKSMMFTIVYPTWVWQRKPEMRFMTASYSSNLSAAHSIQRRNLIDSDFYQMGFGSRYQISADQNVKTEFSNDKGGSMFATSITGTATGKGCFVGETLVSTADGKIRIDTLCGLQSPPKIIAFDHEENRVVERRLVWSRRLEAAAIAIIKCDSGRSFQCTLDHPVFVKGEGYKEAQHLRAGDRLYSLKEQKEQDLLEGDTVSSIEFIRTCSVPVYDIEVERCHNFFANEVLVHNCNRLLIDDPINPKEANSETERANANQDYDSTFPSRLNNKKNDAIIGVMQRLHPNDWVGHVKEKDDWVHLNLPAEAPSRTIVVFPISKKEIIREVGDILHPEREGRKELDAMKKSLGARMFEAQYNQNPTMAEGDLIKRAWWRYWKVIPERFDTVIQSWDLAVKNKDTSDYTVGTVWGKIGADKYLLDRFRARLDFPAQCQALVTMSSKWPQAHKKLIEAKANGPAVVQTMKNKISGIIEYEPKGDKVARVSAVAAAIESGNVYLPHPSICDWTEEFLEEWCAFPNGMFDDQVDSGSQALDDLSTRLSILDVL